MWSRLHILKITNKQANKQCAGLCIRNSLVILCQLALFAAADLLESICVHWIVSMYYIFQKLVTLEDHIYIYDNFATCIEKGWNIKYIEKRQIEWNKKIDFFIKTDKGNNLNRSLCEQEYSIKICTIPLGRTPFYYSDCFRFIAWCQSINYIYFSIII